MYIVCVYIHYIHTHTIYMHEMYSIFVHVLYTHFLLSNRARGHFGGMLRSFIHPPHSPSEQNLHPNRGLLQGSRTPKEGRRGGEKGRKALPCGTHTHPPPFSRIFWERGSHLGVGAELPLVLMEQRGDGGAGGADQDLETGVAGGTPAGGPAGEGTGEAFPELPHRQHRAVGGAAPSPFLQRRAQPATTQTQEGEQTGGDEEETQPHAFVLRLRVLVSRPAPRHGPVAAGSRRRAAAAIG